MKAAQREANMVAPPAPSAARPESSRRKHKEQEEAAAVKVGELEAALKAAEAQSVMDKEAVQQAEAARDSIARQLITASQSVAYLKAEQARLHADLANAQATEAALVDSADGEHEALYYQLQEANQNASNLTYYVNVANQRVMQLEQQVCACDVCGVCWSRSPLCPARPLRPVALPLRKFRAHGKKHVGPQREWQAMDESNDPVDQWCVLRHQRRCAGRHAWLLTPVCVGTTGQGV